MSRVLPGTGSPSSKAALKLTLTDSFGWYDVSVRMVRHPAFEQWYAGRVETGASSFSDPVMGSI